MEDFRFTESTTFRFKGELHPHEIEEDGVVIT